MKEKNLHTIDTVFVLVLFAVFVITTLMVTSSGALAYQNAVKQMDERFNKQTCISYITAKVRANNASGRISVGDFKGNEALCITDNVNGTGYTTYIYQSEGMIRELFCNDEVADSMEPESGAALAEANGLSFAEENNVLTIQLTDTDEKITTIYINML